MKGKLANGLGSQYSHTTSERGVIIIIGIQPLGRSGQRPEFSQATGMALVRCILGKFLGVAWNLSRRGGRGGTWW